MEHRPIPRVSSSDQDASLVIECRGCPGIPAVEKYPLRCARTRWRSPRRSLLKFVIRYIRVATRVFDLGLNSVSVVAVADWDVRINRISRFWRSPDFYDRLSWKKSFRDDVLQTCASGREEAIRWRISIQDAFNVLNTPSRMYYFMPRILLLEQNRFYRI